MASAATGGGKTVTELRAESADDFFFIACAWQKRTGEALTVPIAPWMKKELAIAAETADAVSVLAPTKCKLLHPDRVIDAFMKLRYSLAPMQKGELFLEIEGHGAFRLYADEKNAFCERAEGKKADLSLSPREAVRMLFGPLPAMALSDLAPHVLSWLPLPFCWNFLDLV